MNSINRLIINSGIILIIFISGCVQPESTVSSLDGNNSPVIKDVYIDPLIITVGATATIKVTAVDPDGDALKYAWSSALGDIIGSGSEVRYTAAFCCVGLNTITVTVSDTKGAKVSSDIRIEIQP
ncbi:Hypothetical protein IALB_1941 [Ignavibacterium album JCM 16511]|uniref:PKD/Chitinase domain-containing protein n=1 Tax=Ignavibacterium album (strain DSM 19864 / JCM 16511 / NBRC 101810 / Mat9-16) TaxID=945713 RepID=I0AKZ0_IGNAJ|nr:Ig-like domain-containing protein [Ignavibacterium album]AFH49647.1 Hypothetical protein IALB_1941 [Ignavibacterium album JCM 16511]